MLSKLIKMILLGGFIFHIGNERGPNFAERHCGSHSSIISLHLGDWWHLWSFLSSLRIPQWISIHFCKAGESGESNLGPPELLSVFSVSFSRSNLLNWYSTTPIALETLPFFDYWKDAKSASFSFLLLLERESMNWRVSGIKPRSPWINTLVCLLSEQARTKKFGLFSSLLVLLGTS